MKGPFAAFTCTLLVMLFSAVPASAQYLDFAFELGEAEIPADPFWVEEQGIVAEVRLVPQRLFVASEAVIDSDSRKLLPAGAQLVPLALDMPVVCNVEQTEDLEYRSARKRVCLVDEDGDGSFDTYFERGVNGPRTIQLSVQLKDRRSAIQPVRLTEVSPDQMLDAPYLSLHYQRYVDDGNWFQAALDASGGNPTPDGSFIRFHAKLGRENEGRRTWLAPGCENMMRQPFCTTGSLPNEFSFWGMRMRILERENEDLRFQILSSFQPIPFRMHD